MRLLLILSVLAMMGFVSYSAMQSFSATDGATPSADLTAELQEAAATIEANRAAFDTESTALNETITSLTAENLDQKARLETVIAERDQLQSQLEDTTQRLSMLEAETAAAATDDGEMEQQLAALTTNLESSETALRDAEAAIADLERERDELAQQLTESATDQQPTDSQVAETNENAAALAEAQERIAMLTEITTNQLQTASELTEEITAYEAEVATLAAEASTLADEVAKRDAVITGLMARTETTNVSLEPSCQERTDAVFAAASISFGDGTAEITDTSAPLLDQLAGIASDCVLDDLTLEIEGHTSDTGDEASNLLLSNARAAAVRDYLEASGVPASAMRAVGLGGSEPVADSQTADGESQNHRIVFDWEQS